MLANDWNPVTPPPYRLRLHHHTNPHTLAGEGGAGHKQSDPVVRKSDDETRLIAANVGIIVYWSILSIVLEEVNNDRL